MKVYAKGTIKNGKLTLDDQSQFLNDLKIMPEGRVELCVKVVDHKHKNRRVENLLWGVVLKELSEISGHTEDELYEEYKRKFLKDKESSTELSEKEFNEFFDKIVRHAQQFYGAEFKRLHSAV